MALPGCAKALKEAPPVVDLAGGGPPPSPSEVDALLRQAEAAFARRAPEGAAEATGLYLRAASGDPKRVEGLLGAAETQVWLTDHEADPHAREVAAKLAVQAAQWCERTAPDLPACAYWMGAALGVQARERPTTGLSALPQIEAAFQKAAAKEPALEQGGPDRALALLYLRAPGWPTGPGDPDRGLEEARKAMTIASDYPPNVMALAEALVKTGDEAAGRSAWSRALDLSRQRSAQGDPDAAEWIAEAERALRK